MRRKRILAISFFPAFHPATSGGELRIYNIYCNLAKYFDVTLVSSTHFDVPSEEVHHIKGFRELRIPKDQDWHEAYGALNRAGIVGELSGLAFSIAVENKNCALRKCAIDLALQSDVIIHESPFSEPIFSEYFGIPEIYCSHNVESALLSSISSGTGFAEAFTRLVRLENRLIKRAVGLTATSEEDANQFKLLWGCKKTRVSVAPNGYEYSTSEKIWKYRQKFPPNETRVLFGGSKHNPNLEAAKYIIEIAKLVPHVNFDLFGSVCEGLTEFDVGVNVKLYGVVSDKERNELLCRASAVLNPVNYGSGTNLKSLEALACGIPLICTPFGARGLDIRDGENAIISSRLRLPHVLAGLPQDSRLETVGLKGREVFQKNYEWSSIAEHLSVFIRDVIDEQVGHFDDSQTSDAVLVLNDYQISGELGGGAERIRNIYANFGSRTIILTLGNAFGVHSLGKNIVEITIQKSHAQREHEADWSRTSPKVSAGDIMSYLHVRHNFAFNQILHLLVREAKCAVVEHCYLQPVADVLRTLRLDLPIIYSAHNVESDIKRQLLRAVPGGAALAAIVPEFEAKLTRDVDAVVVCSALEGDHFRNLGARHVILARNGALAPGSEAVKQPLDATCDTIVGFIGSAHPPNVNAVQFLIEEVAPRCLNLKFEIIGGVCAAFSSVPPNVTLLHKLDDADRNYVMSRWALAVNPVEEGGGTNLKIAEFIVRGLPIVSTKFGTRGLSEEELSGISIKSRIDFADGILDMVGKNLTGARPKKSSLEWRETTQEFSSYLSSLPPFLWERPKRLLIVSYRYTEPPLGGAEEYIAQISKYLREYFGSIELAVADVVTTRDHHHFGTCIQEGECGAARFVGSAFDRVHVFDVVQPSEQEVVESCNRLEAAWQAEESTIAAQHLRGIAERHVKLLSIEGLSRNNERKIIFSPKISIHVPDEIDRLIFIGFSEENARIMLWFDSETPVIQNIKDSFSVEIRRSTQQKERKNSRILRGVLSLPTGGKVELRLIGLAKERGDFVFQPAAKLVSDALTLPTTYSFQDRMLEFSRIAVSRNEELNSDFDKVRGPHSPDLEEWVNKNYNKYDVILIQGVPFRTIPGNTRAIRSSSKKFPVVLLPHFHGDDRFYWWSSYIKSFQDATCTIFPSVEVKKFFSTLGVQSAVVGHGALAADEIVRPSRQSRIRMLLPHLEGPFVLVLGRKAPSKGYRRVAEAVSRMRTRGVRLSLVMIGPDEDGQPVCDDGTYYLGRQPRSTVLSALREALCLVTLSESESFGMVILEAWRAGKAVIGNKACMAHCDLIRNGVDGFLVSDDVELERVLLDWYANPESANAMGAAGRSRLTSGFTWDRVAADFAKVLLGCVNEARADPNPADAADRITSP